MADVRSYSSGNFFFDLDGMTAGFLKSTEGGSQTAEVIGSHVLENFAHAIDLTPDSSSFVHDSLQRFQEIAAEQLSGFANAEAGQPELPGEYAAEAVKHGVMDESLNFYLNDQQFDFNEGLLNFSNAIDSDKLNALDKELIPPIGPTPGDPERSPEISPEFQQVQEMMDFITELVQLQGDLRTSSHRHF